MKRKITELDIDNLAEYLGYYNSVALCNTESLEKRITRLESIICKMIERDVKRMGEQYEKDMKEYERKWGNE